MSQIVEWHSITVFVKCRRNRKLCVTHTDVCDNEKDKKYTNKFRCDECKNRFKTQEKHDDTTLGAHPIYHEASSIGE